MSIKSNSVFIGSFYFVVVLWLHFFESQALVPLIVAPFGGTFKLLTQLTIPIPIGTKQQLGYGTNFQFQYPLAKAANQLGSNTVQNGIGRRKRSAWNTFFANKTDQEVFYDILESTMTKHGLDGRQCVLRYICEIAGSGIQEDSLFGQLIHILLTPKPVILNRPQNDYSDAHKAGIYGVECSTMFSKCKFNSFMDIITHLT